MRSPSPFTALRALWQMRVRGRPFVLTHGINARCNMSCRFCEYWKKPGRQMSTEEIKRMLDEAADLGIGVYNAWTVEPLLRGELPEILKHARSRGLMTSLITNGLLLKKRAGELEDLDLLSVSVDGIKSYRGLRGCDVQVVLDGIRSAQEMGHEVLMNCVISEANLGELEDLVILAQSSGCKISFEPMHESSGIDGSVWRSLQIRKVAAFESAVQRLIELKRMGGPIINSITYLEMVRDSKRAECISPDRVSVKITDVELKRAEFKSSKLKSVDSKSKSAESKGHERSSGSGSSMAGSRAGLGAGSRAFRCHAADMILHVAPDGTLGTCRVHQEPLGNVSEGLERAWRAGQKRRREIVSGCEGCLFFGYVENSLLYDFVPEVMMHYDWM